MVPHPNPRPLVLVHAWAESRHAFGRLIDALPASLTPVAVDLPGDVASTSTAGYSVIDIAAHLTTVIEDLNYSSAGPGRAIVLGASSGGYVAQQLAVDHPEMLDALVLVGSPITLRGKSAFADGVERLQDPVDVGWVREFFTWFPLHHPVPAAYIDDRILDAAAIPAQVWKDTLIGLYEATPPLETGSISTPTLVISGGSDGLLGTAHRDLVAAIHDARGVVYKGTGHLVLWEQPERIAADVVSFIDALDPYSPR